MTNRTQRLKDALFASPREISLERALLYTASHQQTEGEPVILRRAKATAYILDHVNIAIRDEELIAGNRTVKPRAGIMSPEMDPYWLLKELDQFSTRPQDRFEIGEADKQIYRDVLYPYWEKRSMKDFINSQMTDEVKAAVGTQIFSVNQTDKGQGHIIIDYPRLLNNGLGVLVELVDNRDQLLSFLDSEISQALSYHFSNNNITVRHNEEYDRVEGLDNGVILHLKSGKKIKADALLWCNGRTGNTDKLGMENIGVKVNSRGQIEVDENYRTCVPNIYGAGDVIGWPSLASAAHDQGRSAAGSIVDNGSWRFVNDVPTGIYTIPEISSIGKNEQELTQAKVPYEVGKAFFKSMARAQIAGEPQGMLKILFHRETLEVLGVHCFGYQASEIVHIGQAIMNQPGELNTLKYFVNTTFNYPTMAEAYRVAAYDGLNRLF